MYTKIKKILIVALVLGIMLVIINIYLRIIENKLNIIIEIITKQGEYIEIDANGELVEDEVNEETEYKTEGENENNILGKIMIPKINLIAEIKEGTEKEIIDYYVGHFEDTSLNDGNIGLAAHNRGNEVKSYFANIKNLQENDIIIYQTKEIERTYLVKIVKIIEDTDFSYLQPTQDNRITLITCVNNQPEYRLCVQAVEKT